MGVSQNPPQKNRKKGYRHEPIKISKRQPLLDEQLSQQKWKKMNRAPLLT